MTRGGLKLTAYYHIHENIVTTKNKPISTNNKGSRYMQLQQRVTMLDFKKIYNL